MSPEPLHDVLESLVRSLVALYRITPVRVRVDIDEDPGNPLSWRVKEIISGVRYGTPDTPTPLPTTKAPEPQVSEEGEDAGKFSQCVADILTVLEKARKPLTTTRILAELARAGKEWSERHVSRWLAHMTKDGTLSNPENGRPRGYRLPEWETPSAESD